MESEIKKTSVENEYRKKYHRAVFSVIVLVVIVLFLSALVAYLLTHSVNQKTKTVIPTTLYQLNKDNEALVEGGILPNGPASPQPKKAHREAEGWTSNDWGSAGPFGPRLRRVRRGAQAPRGWGTYPPPKIRGNNPTTTSPETTTMEETVQCRRDTAGRPGVDIECTRVFRTVCPDDFGPPGQPGQPGAQEQTGRPGRDGQPGGPPDGAPGRGNNDILPPGVRCEPDTEPGQPGIPGSTCRRVGQVICNEFSGAPGSN